MKKHNILKIVLLIVTFLMLVSWFLPDDNWILVKSALWLAEFVLIIIALRDKSSVIKIVLLTVLALMLLSWVLPAAYYSDQYLDQGRVQMGLFDLFNYPVTALSYFGYIAFFILAIGGFYGILNKIPAYRTFLDKFVGMTKGKEKLTLVVIMLLIAALVSLGGMQIPLLVFFPMLISIILLMGYDKIVAAMTLVGSTAVGLIGSTYAYGNTSMIMSILSLDITSEVITKVVILLLGLILLVVNVFLYIKKANTITKVIKKDSKKVDSKIEKVEEKKEKTTKKTVKSDKDTKSTKSKSKSSASKTTSKKNTKSSSKKNIKAALKDEEVIVVKENVKHSEVDKFVSPSSNGNHNIWPFVTMFVILFILVVLAFMPWATGFGVEAFSTATTNVLNFELFGFPIFSKLFGTINAFGYWTIIDLLFPMALIILFLAFIYKVKFSDILNGFIDGIKKALPLGLIVILLYTCLVIVTYHPFQLVIYKALLSVVDKFNVLGVVLSSLVATLAGFFNVDPAYAFQSVLLYFTSVVSDTASYPAVGVVFQAMYGFGVIFAPTSFILMIVLEYLDIPYTSWIKSIWKFLLELLAVLLIVFTLLVVL